MPRRPNGGGLFVATQAFSTMVGNTPTVVQVGERIREGHELLRRYPEYFKPADTGVEYDVEQATAAPGELRGDVRP